MSTQYITPNDKNFSELIKQYPNADWIEAEGETGTISLLIAKIDVDNISQASDKHIIITRSDGAPNIYGSYNGISDAKLVIGNPSLPGRPYQVAIHNVISIFLVLCWADAIDAQDDPAEIAYTHQLAAAYGQKEVA